MSSATDKSVTVTFDPTAISKQSDVISAATPIKAGVMSAQQAGDLASIVAGTVSSVSGTAPIVSTGGLNPDISITPATTLAPGSMSAADKAKLDGLGAVSLQAAYNNGNEIDIVPGVPVIISGGADTALQTWSLGATPKMSVVIDSALGNSPVLRSLGSDLYIESQSLIGAGESGRTLFMRGGRGGEAGTGGVIFMTGGDADASTSTANGGDVNIRGGSTGVDHGIAGNVNIDGGAGNDVGGDLNLNAGTGFSGDGNMNIGTAHAVAINFGNFLTTMGWFGNPAVVQQTLAADTLPDLLAALRLYGLIAT